jgi:spore cortex formation protein SpoVR/YcgB (stage V sporulation)
MEKNAPLLESWQRDPAHRAQSQPVFLPAETDPGDERRVGTFWHYTILNHLYDEGKVTERFMLEFSTATLTWCSSRLQQSVVQRD